MESIPAVFVTGSTVNTINVSVQKGQSASVGSPPRSPTNKMLMRLLPFQVGYSRSAARGSGVNVALGVFVPLPTSGVSSGMAVSPAQLAGGMPGSEVIRQQMVSSRTKTESPMAAARVMLQKII